MSKVERGFFEKYFKLRFGRPARNNSELSKLARELAKDAIRHAMVEEFERHDPGRTSRGWSEVL